MTQSLPGPSATALAVPCLAEAVLATMLARLRSIRALMETQPGGIDPFSPEAETHARLLAMEARLEVRRRPVLGEEGGREVFYLD